MSRTLRVLSALAFLLVGLGAMATPAAAAAPCGAPWITLSGGSVLEGNSGQSSLTFTAYLADPTDCEVSATFFTSQYHDPLQPGDAAHGRFCADGVDVAQVTGTTITIPAYADPPQATVTVQVCGDTRDEGQEVIVGSLKDVVNSWCAESCGGFGVINDDDPNVTLSPATVSVNETNATQNVRLTVTLGAPAATAFNVTVNSVEGMGTARSGATCDGTADFIRGPYPVAFTPGMPSATVDVPVCGDLLDENSETFTVRITGAGQAAIGSPSETTITIVDNDPQPALSVANANETEGNSFAPLQQRALRFNVSLTPASGRAVTVTFQTQNGAPNQESAFGAANCTVKGADYIARNEPVTFAAGEVEKTIMVPICADTVDEANEAVTLQLSSPVSATITDSSALGLIINDDNPTLSIADASIAEGLVGARSLSFTVSLSNPSHEEVSVDWRTSDATASTMALNACGSGGFVDYLPASGTLTIPAGQPFGTIVVQVCGDTNVENDESFNVQLSNQVNATMGDNAAVGTIVNDDRVIVFP